MGATALPIGLALALNEEQSHTKYGKLASQYDVRLIK